MPDNPRLYAGLFALLVDQGLLSRTAAAKIQMTTRENWVPIGSVLIDQGKITMDDLAVLLEMQTYEPQLRLGEIAVREGYCTHEEVQQALRVQLAASPPPLEVLLSEVRGDRDLLCRVLLRYIGQIEARLVAQQLPV